MSPFLQIEREGGIVTVRMNHPDTRNALTTREQIQEFVDLCAELRRDMSVRVMVLTGNGSAFVPVATSRTCTSAAAFSPARRMNCAIPTVMVFSVFPWRFMSLISQ